MRVAALDIKTHVLQEMPRYQESKFALVVENVASVTRASDVRYECEYFGDVRRCERDRDLRVCLLEFERCAEVAMLF